METERNPEAGGSRLLVQSENELPLSNKKNPVFFQRQPFYSWCNIVMSNILEYGRVSDPGPFVRIRVLLSGSDFFSWVRIQIGQNSEKTLKNCNYNFISYLALSALSILVRFLQNHQRAVDPISLLKQKADGSGSETLDCGIELGFTCPKLIVSSGWNELMCSATAPHTMVWGLDSWHIVLWSRSILARL